MNIDEHTIRKLDEGWGAAASRKDLEAVVALYAEDGSTVWPGAPASYGTENIRAAWAAMFGQFKGLSLGYQPERIVVANTGANAGDMASDFGKVLLGYDTPQGRVEAVAKYVVVWMKVEGTWKVLYDCYNMNTPDA